MDWVSKVSGAASGPWTAPQSHVPINSSLSQLTKHQSASGVRGWPLCVFTVEQLPGCRHAAFVLEFLSAGIRKNPSHSVICHSWLLRRWKCTRMHQRQILWKKKERTKETHGNQTNCTDLLYNTLKKMPFPPPVTCHQPQPRTRPLTGVRSHSWLPSLLHTLCLFSHSFIFSSDFNWRSIAHDQHRPQIMISIPFT